MIYDWTVVSFDDRCGHLTAIHLAGMDLDIPIVHAQVDHARIAWNEYDRGLPFGQRERIGAVDERVAVPHPELGRRLAIDRDLLNLVIRFLRNDVNESAASYVPGSPARGN